MQGLEVDENHKVIKNGRIMFGSDFLIRSGIDKFDYLIQRTENGKIKKIIIPALTERSARTKLNKMFPRLKDPNQRPRLITIDYLESKVKLRDTTIKEQEAQIATSKNS